MSLPDEYTKILHHFEGADESTVITESILGNTWTCNDNARLDTSQKKWGSSSLYCPPGGDITTPYDASYSMTNGYTVDTWVRLASVAGLSFMWRQQDANNADWLGLYLGSPDIGVQHDRGGVQIRWWNYPWTPSIDTWYHVEISWDGDTDRIFIGGVLLGSGGWSNSLSDISSHYQIGSSGGGAECWFDEYRFSSICRHTENFTPETKPYYSDSVPKINLLGVGK